MNVDADTTVPELLALVGAIVAAVGTYVPWIVAAPGRQAVPAIYLPGMGWRFAGHDYLVVGLLVVGLAVAGRHRHERLGGHLAAGTGVVVALLTGYVVVTSLEGFLGAFVPGAGVAVTLAGALLLVVAGRRQTRTVGSHDDGVGTAD